MGKIFTLLLVLGALQGCTVLGFATDMALYSVLGEPNNNKGSGVNDNHRNPLPFTTEGLEHDAKVVTQLISGAMRKSAATAPVVEDGPLFPADYANKRLCEKDHVLVTECYGPEYYQQFYEKAQSSVAPAMDEAVLISFPSDK